MVFEPRFYEGFADMMQEDELPIFNWIWFGLWKNEKGLNGYTYGMEAFGKDEMEVLAPMPSRAICGLFGQFCFLCAGE